MTLARDIAVQNLEANTLQQRLGRPTHNLGNEMRGAIGAVYSEAKTSYDSFPLGSKFGFSAATLKKDTYIDLHNTLATGLSATANLATTWLFTHPRHPDTYDDTILVVHPDISRHKKEAQQADLITQYEILKDTRTHSRKKYSSRVTKHIFSQ